MSDNKELCKWLRDNSSGAYRNSELAAYVIEALDSKVILKDTRIEELEYFVKMVAKRDYTTVDEVLYKATKLMENNNAKITNN